MPWSIQVIETDMVVGFSAQIKPLPQMLLRPSLSIQKGGERDEKGRKKYFASWMTFFGLSWSEKYS